jgi:hypothetical protein
LTTRSTRDRSTSTIPKNDKAVKYFGTGVDGAANDKPAILLQKYLVDQVTLAGAVFADDYDDSKIFAPLLE